MPTPDQYLDPSYSKQILELVPVSVSGTTTTFQVVYGGTPLANATAGIGYSLYPLATGLPLSLLNYDNKYASLYLGSPNIAPNTSGTVVLNAAAAAISASWPNLTSLPGTILEFSLPYPSGPLSLEIKNTSQGYNGIIEYSDDPRFPSLISATASGASVSNSIGATGDKLDYFSLVVPTGTSFDSLILAGLAGSGSANYTIYRSGSVDANSSIVAAGQISSGPSGVTAGQNLLTAGTTNTQALASGIYTVKIENQSSSEIAYQLDISSYIALPQFVGNEDTPFNIALPSTTSGNISISWQAAGLPAGVTLETANGLSRLAGQTELNFNGIKSFNLTATENNPGGKQASYTGVTLAIAPVNDGPALSTINSLTGGVEDTAKVITYNELAAAANAADFDGDIPSFRVEALSRDSGYLKKSTSSGFQDVQVGTNGTLLSPGDSFQWLPAANANGLLNAFTVTAVDAALASSPPIQVAINTAAVNDAPTLTAISTITGATEDLFKEITYDDLAAAANEADVDSSNLSFRIEALSTGTLQKWNAGSSSWDSAQAGSTLIAPGEKLQWKGAQDANGVLDAFTIKTWDGALASSTAVQVAINTAAVNDAPTLKAISTITGATEDLFKEITYADLAAAANEADVDSSNLRFRIEALSTGTLQKWNAGSSSWDSAQAGSTLIASGEKLRWKGAQDANGVLDAFTIKTWDGALASSTAVQVKVTTAAVDDAPGLLPTAQTFSIRENQPFATSLETINLDPTDAVTLSLEGTDANAFTITQAGLISLNQPGNYESKQSYSVTVRATDTTAAQLSTTSSLSLSILDQPDQILTLTPQSLAFVPTLDTRITLNASYKQDAPLPADSAPTSFTAVLAYDGASLDLAPSTVGQSGISLSNNDAGSTGPSTLTITAANGSQISSFNLDFDVTPGVTGPFAFSWSLPGATGYEQQTNSPITISPDAEAFISNGILNLSSFQTPLRITTESKNVFLLEQQNIALPYQSTISRLLATGMDDQISVAQSLNLDAGAGNDTVDLRPLSEISLPVAIDIRMGGGRDTLVLPATMPAAGSQIQVSDFELGFDRVQLTTGSLVNRRSDVLELAIGPQGVLRQSAVNLRFAAVAADLDPGLKTLVSAQTPIVPSSIALDPGSDGRQLRLSLTAATQSDNPARITAPAPTSLPGGYSWSIAVDGASATMTLPAQFSLLTGLADLRRAVSALVPQAEAKSRANLQLEWLDAQGVILSSVVSAVEVIPRIVDGGSTPIKLDFRAPTTTSAVPTQLNGSAVGDTIHLISDAFDNRTDKAFGGIGDDLLIAGDGDRLIGGEGSDTLVAYRGLGSTQLSGGVGNDLLIGGENDALIGGAGNDMLAVRGLGNRMIGGSGSDIFILADAAFGPFSSGSTTPNRVLDFKNTDQLAFNLPGFQRNDFTIVDSSAGAIIRLSESWSSRLGASDLAILQGVDARHIVDSQILINHSQAAIATSTLSRVDLVDQTS